MSTDNGSETLADIERKLREKTETVRRLLRERDHVTAKRNEIDEQLQRLSGKTVEQLLEEFNEDFVGGGDAVREVFDLADKLMNKQKRNDRPKSIPDYVEEVLAKTPGLKPGAITQAVLDAGCETTSTDFGRSISVVLARLKKDGRVVVKDGRYHLPRKR